MLTAIETGMAIRPQDKDLCRFLGLTPLTPCGDYPVVGCCLIQEILAINFKTRAAQCKLQPFQLPTGYIGKESIIYWVETDTWDVVTLTEQPNA
jgi:hypothetical protein